MRPGRAASEIGARSAISESAAAAAGVAASPAHGGKAKAYCSRQALLSGPTVHGTSVVRFREKAPLDGGTGDENDPKRKRPF